MATTRIKTPLSKAFVVDERKARDLFALFARHGDVVRISAEVPNGTVEFEGIDEFLAFPNSSRRPIQSLKIEARRADRSFTCAIKFSFPYQLHPIVYEAEGDHADVIVFADRVEDALSGVGQWHSFFTALHPYYQGMFGVTSWLAKGAAFTAAAGAFSLYASGKFDPPALGKVVPAIGALILVALAYDHRHWLLPAGVFCIGDGIKRHERRVATLKFLVGAVGLSGIALPLLSAVISKYLGAG